MDGDAVLEGGPARIRSEVPSGCSLRALLRRVILSWHKRKAVSRSRGTVTLQGQQGAGMYRAEAREISAEGRGMRLPFVTLGGSRRRPMAQFNHQ